MRTLWISIMLSTLFCAPAAMPEEVRSVVAANPAPPAADYWHAMNFEQRHEEMTFAIHPSLARRWQQHYQTPEPRLQCVTCHGKDAELHRYQMAYSPLDDLKPSRVQALYRADTKLTEEQRFKRDVATPLMAELLGVPAYDPATGLGFSCFGCHPRESE